MSRAPGHGPGYPCLGHGFLGLGPRLKTLDMSRAPGQGPGYPCLGHTTGVLGLKPLDLGLGTKQLKPLDMSRAPGHGPGYPCLGHGLILGL
jgi:hypothetical protein